MDAYFFDNGRKKVSVFKNIRIRVQGTQNSADFLYFFFVSSFRSFQRPWQISLPFHILQLRFHTPEAWKRYPFRLEPPRIGHYRDTPTGESSQEIFTELTTCRELWKYAQLWVHVLISVSQFLVKSTLIQLTIRRAAKVNYLETAGCFCALMRSFDFWYLTNSCVKPYARNFHEELYINFQNAGMVMYAFALYSVTYFAYVQCINSLLFW